LFNYEAANNEKKEDC